MIACPAEYIGFAHRLGNIAADILRDSVSAELVLEIKPDGTPVTAVDRIVETSLRGEIERVFPAHGVIGEEFPSTQADAEWVWIIDPIDGTKEFIQGLPLFGVLLALAHDGELVLGLAEQPLTRDRWIGAKGHGARCNGRPARVRSCATLDRAVVSVMGYDSFCSAYHQHLSLIRKSARSIIVADSFYVFGLLASGRVDLIVSNGFALHDYAALDVIVREAGGTTMDWNGQPLTMRSGPSIIAAGDPRLAAQVLPPLSGTAPA